MKKYGRKDGNHNAIADALREIGCSVLDLSPMGDGCPDLLIWSGRMMRYVLVEVKNGDLPPSRRRLTPDQIEFHQTWRGPIVVLESVSEALQLFGGVRA